MKRLILLLIFASVAPAQLQIDPQIAAEITKIKAIDNHAHPVSAAGGDTGYDALPVEHMEPYTEPVRMRPDHPSPPRPRTNCSPAAFLPRMIPIPTGFSISSGSKPCLPIASLWARALLPRGSYGCRTKTR